MRYLDVSIKAELGSFSNEFRELFKDEINVVKDENDVNVIYLVPKDEDSEKDIYFQLTDAQCKLLSDVLSRVADFKFPVDGQPRIERRSNR